MTPHAFDRDLSELQIQCSALATAIETGNPERMSAAVREVTVAWLTAKATLDIAAEPNAHATTAHVALCAAHSVLDRLFRRAWAALPSDTVDAASARATLRTLAAVLDFTTEPENRLDAGAAANAPSALAAPGAARGNREAAGRPAPQDAEPPSSPLIHARALDAFEAFYQQLAMVLQRIEELGAAFDTRPLSAVVLIAADLNSAWGVLHARIELLEAVTNDDAGRELWTLPTMQLARERLNAVLRDGAVFVSRHLDDGWPMLMQLRRLAAKLTSGEQITTAAASTPSSEPQPSTASIKIADSYGRQHSSVRSDPLDEEPDA